MLEQTFNFPVTNFTSGLNALTSILNSASSQTNFNQNLIKQNANNAHTAFLEAMKLLENKQSKIHKQISELESRKKASC
jgi:hypothetical protein